MGRWGSECWRGSGLDLLGVMGDELEEGCGIYVAVVEEVYLTKQYIEIIDFE